MYEQHFSKQWNSLFTKILAGTRATIKEKANIKRLFEG